MKLLQLNVEGRKHLDLVTGFIKDENPDVITLQETDESIFPFLFESGYKISFIPKVKRNYEGALIEEGELIAARQLDNVKKAYYYNPQEVILEQNHVRYHETTAFGYVLSDCIVDDISYTFLTTHFTWAPRGEIATEEQTRNLSLLFNLSLQEKPHIMTGDFNIPRFHNPLYQVITKHYKDCIPLEYKSSLDKTLHRLGGVASRGHLFTDFMVDYVFTQPTYEVSNVELHFGVSDHAAVTADIKKVEL